MTVHTHDEEAAARRLLDDGLLFEINRHILHPRGLALAVAQDDSGSFAGFRLCETQDPEGFVFAEDTLREGSEKFAASSVRCGARIVERLWRRGFMVQPLAGEESP